MKTGLFLTGFLLASTAYGQVIFSKAAPADSNGTSGKREFQVTYFDSKKETKPDADSTFYKTDEDDYLANTPVGSYRKSLMDSLALVEQQLRKLEKATKKKTIKAPYQDIPSIYPVRKGLITSSFGVRKHPITGENHVHKGIDFALPEGNPVYATGDGTVEKILLDHNGIGLAVFIRHKGGFTSVYGHLGGYEVKPGDKVKRGRQIGIVGNTGNSTGAHVHYTVLYKNKAIDPQPFCDLAMNLQ